MSIRHLAYRLSVPVFMIGLLFMSLLCGCRQSIDPLLLAADSIMEEHPDSALMMLENYHLTSNSTSADSACYALLLTHARYKNFIDETDDSLISVSADYFLDHHDDEKASRALFLKGMIQMNANRLGEAAVSFRKGLDIARKGQHYMWEGQCARGLCMLYGELHDGSSQIDYAKLSNDAFEKTGDEGWIVYSELNVARALHNNCKYEKSLSFIGEMYDNPVVIGDTLTLAELSQLEALSLFALGRYSESVESYRKVCELNPSILTPADLQNIHIAIYNSPQDSTASLKSIFPVDSMIGEESIGAFAVLAREGRYKEAYELLENYKASQDSVLSEIFSNNVSESIHQYEATKEAIKNLNLRHERLIYALVCLILIIVGIIVVLYLRECMRKEEALRVKTEADLENLRLDFKIQLETVEALSDKPSRHSDTGPTVGFEKIIKQHYADTNRICDSYYQGYYKKNNSEAIKEEIDKIVRSFTEEAGLDEIIKYVDEISGNLYSSFKKTFFNLTEEECRLFLYLILGFNSNSISIFLNQKVSAVYNKKSRLKAKIMKCDVPDRDYYLSFF